MNLILSSSQWTAVADWIALTGIALAAIAAWLHFRDAREGADASKTNNLAARAKTFALVLAALALFASVWQRGIEVNHFPSQTMSEVLTVFTLALVASMIALHYALGLRKRSPGWAILDDALVAIVLGGSYAIHVYIDTLSTAQRDLPPALQSYWFPPHLSSLIFSYATLAIAGAIALVYFCLRFWSGVFVGGQPRARQWITLLVFALVPFLHVVALPVMLVCGAVMWILHKNGKAPNAAAMGALEKSLDDVSFRAFSVGMPFLTAGLFMGAFWAQEAWANYWGWDSKENSALITWLIYVIYIHLRMLGGYRGEKAMALLVGGAFSIFITFQLFGYLPDSQKSLHRYTDDNVVPREGMQGPSGKPQASESPAPSETDEARGG